MTEVGYASDKPSDCAYCYFFSAGRKKCKRKECFYRISSPPLRRKVTHWEPCEGCPYMQLMDLSLNHADGMYRLFQDKNVVDFIYREYAGISRIEVKSVIQNKVENSDEIHKVIMNDENEFVGIVSLTNINKTEETAELLISVDYFDII